MTTKEKALVTLSLLYGFLAGALVSTIVLGLFA